MAIETKRIYDEPRKRAGYRVLVDRLWPRGLRKDQVHVDLWLRDIAPSDALRKWFGHEPARWEEFKRRYFKELDGKQDLVGQLISGAKGRPIVLLYGARDTEHNQAAALKDYVDSQFVQTRSS